MKFKQKLGKVFEPGFDIMDSIIAIIMLVIGYVIYDSMTGASGIIVLPATLSAVFTVVFVLLGLVIVIASLFAVKRKGK